MVNKDNIRHIFINTVEYLKDEYIAWNFEEKYLADDELLLIIDNHLVLFVYQFVEKIQYEFGFGENHKIGISELTYNSLFKFNKSKYYRDLGDYCNQSLGIGYLQYDDYIKEKDNVQYIRDYVNSKTLIDFSKYEKNIPSETYTFIIYRIHESEKYEYAVQYYKGLYDEKKVRRDLYNYVSNIYNTRITAISTANFDKAIMGYRFNSRQSLYNNIQYTLIYKKLYYTDNISSVAKSFLSQCENDDSHFDFKLHTNRNAMKWKTEFEIYNIIKKTYKEALYQERVLLYDRYNCSHTFVFDVYLPKHKIAIEYQGEQHFKPVDLFGGEEGFKKTKIRDQIKKDVAEYNKINMLYINYFDDLSEINILEQIKSKIKYIREEFIKRKKIRAEEEMNFISDISLMEKYCKILENKKDFYTICCEKQQIVNIVKNKYNGCGKIKLDAILRPEDVIYLYNNSKRYDSFLKKSSPYKNYPSLLYYEIFCLLNISPVNIRNINCNIYNYFLQLYSDDLASLDHLFKESINRAKFLYKCIKKYKSKA